MGTSPVFAFGYLPHDVLELRERIRLKLIGFPYDVVRQVVANGGRGGAVWILDLVEHSVTAEAMRSGGCLLVFFTGRDVVRLSEQGQIYDHMRAGEPVLFAICQGGTIDLLRADQVGWSGRSRRHRGR